MINFSKINKKSFLGKILRFFLKLIPKKTILPILQGPLRGSKWIVKAGVGGYWLGSYEVADQSLMVNNINKGDVVYDIGAHVGFFTLLASKLTGVKGKVYAFEP